ncbi:MAG: YkvA family protein [Candidatus Kapaibacterium sp.]
MSDFNSVVDGDEAELPEGRGFGERKARKILERRADNVSSDDLRNLTDRLRKKVGELKDLEDGLHWIGTLIGRAKLLFGMIRDRDFRVDVSTTLLVAAGLLYFILPTDLTPDFIPGIGYIDDAVVLGTLWKMVSAEVERYIDFLQDTGRADGDLESLAFGKDATAASDGGE